MKLHWAALLLAATQVTAMHQTPRFMPGYRKLQSKMQAMQRDAEAQAAADNLPQTYSAKFAPRNDGEAATLQQILGLYARQENSTDGADAASKYPDVKEANLTQPLDHFGDSTKATFQQRYWYSLRHYKPNSGKPTPVYVLDSGEVDASTRLPYLDHGILDILANATDGIGVVLEHRYYGTSIPNRTELGDGTVWGPDQLRWLTLDQALEDNAQFVQNMTFDGVAEGDMANLRAPNTPVISYGGSYPGTKSAFVRVKYPDLIFGSLASSAVVAAIEQFPQYYYPIAAGAQQDCAQAIQASIGYIDSVIAPDPSRGGDQPDRDANKTSALQALFGLEELDAGDFANVLTIPLSSFQSLNWDPSVGTTDFADFCTALVGQPSGPVDPAPQRRQDANDTASANPTDAPQIVQNYGQYIKKNFVQACTDTNTTVSECFGTQDWSTYTNATALTDDNAISWTFQFCTQFGYLMSAPPMVKSSDDPFTFTTTGSKLISSVLDLDYVSQVCHKGFLPGEQYSVPDHPQVQEVNKYGNFSIAYDRLAFIDGQYDPWRPATVHSETFAFGGNRVDTLDRPFKLIANCWHHCDENGNRTSEPPRVRQIHQQEIDFVQHWLTQWKGNNSTAATMA